MVAEGHEVRRRIGLTSQDATVHPLLTGRENLVMLGRLHQLPRARARERAAELLAEFDLDDAADRPSGGYSGGMRRRLDLAATLVSRPRVLFLDEPTTGLDPRARLELWGVLDTLVHSGTTVLLTTQYLDEAERLADEIVVVDHGRIVAGADARSLKRRVGGDTVAAVARDVADLGRIAAVLEELTGHRPTLERALRLVSAPTAAGLDSLVSLAARLDSEGIAPVDDLSLCQPTLDETFLALTGTGLAPPAPDRTGPDRTTTRVTAAEEMPR